MSRILLKKLHYCIFTSCLPTDYSEFADFYVFWNMFFSNEIFMEGLQLWNLKKNFGVKETWIQILPLPLGSCVTLCNPLWFLVSSFLKWNSNTYLGSFMQSEGHVCTQYTTQSVIISYLQICAWGVILFQPLRQSFLPSEKQTGRQPWQGDKMLKVIGSL